MALNCPINNNGIPLKVEGEIFILERGFTEMEVKMDNVGKRQAKGRVYLTSLRLVFVNQKFQSSDFKSFDIPIKQMYGYSIEMPIFGSTHLKASVSPLFNLLPGDSHFKIWLYNGGTDTFIRYLSNTIEALKIKNTQQQQSNNFLRDLANGTFNHKALVDPSDPSTVYLVQPS